MSTLIKAIEALGAFAYLHCPNTNKAVQEWEQLLADVSEALPEEISAEESREAVVNALHANIDGFQDWDATTDAIFEAIRPPFTVPADAVARLRTIKRSGSYADSVLKAYGSLPEGQFFRDLDSLSPHSRPVVSSTVDEVVRLHKFWEDLPQDRGGPNGPKGRAAQAFLTARDSVLMNIGG